MTTTCIAREGGVDARRLAIPRKSQVLVVLALGQQILENPKAALRHAREAARIAGPRGYRFWSMTAHAIIAVVSPDEAEAARARVEARGIAEDLAARVPEAHLADFMEPLDPSAPSP